MPVHLIDSRLFGGHWGGERMREIFDERPRLEGWLEALATLAEAQSELGLIPASAGPAIRRACTSPELDLDAVRTATEETGHSLLGLIRHLATRCDGDAGEWLCYGATVQDISDTATARSLVAAWHVAFEDLRAIESSLIDLARRHRDTAMAGRTHGQPGLPITFGFKVAVWITEIRRHVERLKETAGRLGEGQLCGGVGSLSSFGRQALELQRRYCERMALRPATISWTASRDVQSELTLSLAAIATTLEKIGHEVYNLQRPEIGELREASRPGGVGSITMPQKRNPEISEHLGTLARMIRHNAACLLESQVHDHERDGRSWKVEWGVLGPTFVLAGAVLEHARRLCGGLEVDPEAMARNLEATGADVAAEALMLAAAHRLGKQTAHRLVHAAASTARREGRPLVAVALEQQELLEALGETEIRALLAQPPAAGVCPALVDRALQEVERQRETDRSYLAGEDRAGASSREAES